jgi:hypothetical protein
MQLTQPTSYTCRAIVSRNTLFVLTGFFKQMHHLMCVGRCKLLLTCEIRPFDHNFISSTATTKVDCSGKRLMVCRKI